MEWLKAKNLELSFPNNSIFLKYGKDLLERIMATKNEMFKYYSTDRESNKDGEEIRVKYQFKYNENQWLYLTVTIAYSRTRKVLTLSSLPDLMTREADAYVGQYIKSWQQNEFKEFFAGITERISDIIEQARVKLIEYITQLKNLDNEFIIDSTEYIAKLKDKYPDFNITTEEETGGFGYVLCITSKKDDSISVEFSTSPFSLNDYSGFFRDFIRDSFLDYKGSVSSVKDFYEAVEIVVDGALEYKKHMDSVYEKFSKIVKERDD